MKHEPSLASQQADHERQDTTCRVTDTCRSQPSAAQAIQGKRHMQFMWEVRVSVCVSGMITDKPELNRLAGAR